MREEVRLVHKALDRASAHLAKHPDFLTMPARLRKAGDLWATLRQSKGVDLSRASRYAKQARKKG